jgi:hypothetical protein
LRGRGVEVGGHRTPGRSERATLPKAGTAAPGGESSQLFSADYRESNWPESQSYPLHPPDFRSATPGHHLPINPSPMEYAPPLLRRAGAEERPASGNPMSARASFWGCVSPRLLNSRDGGEEMDVRRLEVIVTGVG